MRLAGDIGGTKTVLVLLKQYDDGSWLSIKEETYASQHFATFDDLLTTFLPQDVTLSSACFGVAGPVVNQCCQTTNLPWRLDALDLKIKLNIPRVKLLNDLEAMALGMMYLPESDLMELNPKAKAQPGNKAVIAAGTGLGEAILYWDGHKHHAMATEGGHCDFAPQNATQDLLLAYLRKHYPEHVSWERILSGMGFGHLYDFLYSQAGQSLGLDRLGADSDVDRNAVISNKGMDGSDALCTAVVQLFAELYGAETGNLALKSLATGGIFIGGGIAPKILPALQDGTFIRAFKAKGRFLSLLDTVSVQVSLNPRTPLLGAIYYFDI